MSIIDFILNLAGLLLWLNWQSGRLDPLNRAVPSTLPGTLRRAAPLRLKRWHFLAALGVLLLLRAVFYWKIGGAVNWTARLDFIATSLPFQSDFFTRMLAFSFLSFALMLVLFYVWLLFFIVINRSAADPLQKLVRLTVGKISRWPNWVLLPLPIVFAILVWLALGPLLAKMNIVPASTAFQRTEQGFLLGLSAFLAWKFLIGAVLVLYMVNSYIYFGNHPIWDFVNLTARRIMKPLRKIPLEIGKVDFTPLLAIVIVFLIADTIGSGRYFYQRNENRQVTGVIVLWPSLADFYRKISP